MKQDPSFASFINSTHNLNDGEPEFEVVFHNAPLKQIIEKTTLKELNELLEKPVFVNPELAQPISLQEAASNRFSDIILS